MDIDEEEESNQRENEENIDGEDMEVTEDGLGEDDADEEELKVVQDDAGGRPMLFLNIPEGTALSSAAFNQPLPLTLMPDGRLIMEANTPSQKRLSIVVQKVEVETHSTRCKTTLTDQRRLQKARDEILALRAANKRLEKRMHELVEERESLPPFVQELVQASLMNNHCKYSRSKLSKDKYSIDFKAFCSEVYKKNHQAYRMLCKSLPFPSQRVVYEFLRLEELSRPADWMPPEPKARVRFKPDQVQFLKAEFEQVKIPSKPKIKEMAEHLQVTEFKVHKWFEAKRATVKAAEDDLKRRLLDEALEEPPDSPLSEAPESEPEVGPPKVRTAEKKPRRYLRPDQLTFLEEWYEKNTHPSGADFDTIVKESCLGRRQCLKWFEHRRYRDGVRRRIAAI